MTRGQTMTSLAHRWCSDRMQLGGLAVFGLRGPAAFERTRFYSARRREDAYRKAERHHARRAAR
jgi:hypothetical protein